MISMLRGMNIEVHHKVKTEELRALYASLKLRDRETYLQSGNVVFQTREVDTRRVGRGLENALEKKYGFRPSAILRTPGEFLGAMPRTVYLFTEWHGSTELVDSDDRENAENSNYRTRLEQRAELPEIAERLEAGGALNRARKK